MKTRAELSEILTNHFVNGKVYRLGRKEIYVRFDPDIQNPSYNCLKFDDHLAEDCVNEAKCHNCGENEHLNEDEVCSSKHK